MAKEKCGVPAGPLAAGKAMEVPDLKPCALSNNGETIALLGFIRRQGPGVSYTKEQDRIRAGRHVLNAPRPITNPYDSRDCTTALDQQVREKVNRRADRLQLDQGRSLPRSGRQALFSGRRCAYPEESARNREQKQAELDQSR